MLQAFEELYLAHCGRLVRFLSRFSTCQNTEEIINDTFMVVWQHASDFRHASQVSKSIIGIAYRTALKSLQRQKKFMSSQSIDDLAEPSTDPARAAEFQDWPARGLNQLPWEHRLTVELAYRMGHSLEEIAAITGSPVGTVKARMFHAREKLRRYLPTLGCADLPEIGVSPETPFSPTCKP